MKYLEKDRNAFLSYLNSVNAEFNSVTIDDYRGFNISVIEVENNSDYLNGIWVYVNDNLNAKHDGSVSLKMAEFLAKEYIEDVLIPKIEERTL